MLKTIRRPPDNDWTAAVIDAIDHQIAIAALPNCHWTDGTLLDLVKIGARCRQVGAALVVDGTQSLGAMPFSVAAVQPDFLITTAHKWLLGPYSLGLAYYGNYFRWFEIGRTELFRSLGVSYASVESRGIFLPVAEAYCKYVMPAKYDDRLIIETTLDTQLKGAIRFDYRIYSEGTQALSAQVYSKHACLNRDGKVVRPPRFIKEIIEKNIQKF